MSRLGSRFLLPSPRLWGKVQNLSCVEIVKTGCHVVLQGTRGASLTFSRVCKSVEHRFV